MNKLKKEDSDHQFMNQLIHQLKNMVLTIRIQSDKSCLRRNFLDESCLQRFVSQKILSASHFL